MGRETLREKRWWAITWNKSDEEVSEKLSETRQ